MLHLELLRRWGYQVFAPGALLRERYESFRELLARDEACLERIAELEDIQHGGRVVDWTRVAALGRELEEECRRLVEAFVALSPRQGPVLREHFQKIAFYLDLALDLPPADCAPPFTLPLEACLHPEQVGGKAANLARARQFGAMPTPPGFTVTASACQYFIESGNLRGEIDAVLRGLDLDRPGELETASQTLRDMILSAPVPAAIEEAMTAALSEILSRLPDPAVRLAVRSSAVAEDADSSFAGQYDSMLDVPTRDLLQAWKQVLAGKYSARALAYRMLVGLADVQTPMAVLVLPMVDAAHAGVIYTRDVDRSASLCGMMTLYAVAGLGDQLVSGRTTPGVFCLDPGAPGEGAAILRRPPGFARLEDGAVLRLAAMAAQLERGFGQPQDIEWAVDKAGQHWLLQSRPLRAEDRAEPPFVMPRHPQAEDDPSAERPAPPMPPDAVPLLEEALCVSRGVASGEARRWPPADGPESLPEQTVLLADSLTPDLVQAMGRLAAVVARRGSRASHFASVAREFSLPVLVVGDDGLAVLHEGEVLTVDACRGRVFAGRVESVLAQRCVAVRRLGPAAQARLDRLLPHAARLSLTDPDSPLFAPERCKSLHDVVRYAHETAVREMFSLLGRHPRGLGSARKLVSRLPLDMYVLDLGAGLFQAARDKAEITPDDITSTPMWALWWGLAESGLGQEQGLPLADWETLDRHSAGLLLDKRLMASYAVIDDAYAHLMLRFGYHFCVVDAFCQADSEKNHIALRFKGGGGAYEQRLLRLEFLREILQRLEFRVSVIGDLLEARLGGRDVNACRRLLVLVGRMLGESRLLDMRLDSIEQVREMVRAFLENAPAAAPSAGAASAS